MSECVNFRLLSKSILQSPRLAAGLVLLGVALESTALTIGRPQGPVWIGKPLDLTIPVSLEAGEGGGSLCVDATVLQGDNAQPERRATASVESGAGTGNPRLRIRSASAIEEPVVHVTVRAGCDAKSTRTYVLLADMPTEVTAPEVSSSRPQAPAFSGAERVRPAVRSEMGVDSGGAATGGSDRNGAGATRRSASMAPAARSQETPSQAARRPAAATTPKRPAVARSAPVVPRPEAQPPVVQAQEPRREAATGGSRLQLDALEPVATVDAGLKTSGQLTLPASEDPARRAAAAADWQAMNAAPPDAQRESQRLQALEATLASLREQTAQNQRTLLALRNELAEARDSRYQNPLVYALATLLVLALLGMLILWRMARRTVAPAWWGEGAAAPADAERGQRRSGTARGLLDDELDMDADIEPAHRAAPPTTFSPPPLGSLVESDDTGFDAPTAHSPRGADNTPTRMVNTEELFDVQQQSDFFLSLGQQEQAIAVLREHIADNPGTSALAYLDLLRIYHSMDRKADYARLASEFETAFNADVPSFEHFNETGKGLEYYRSTLARIEAQWPTPGTLALIEELIFRKPGIHEEGAFDLAAYQELLLLYGIAKEVIDPDSAPPAPLTPSSFLDTDSGEQALTAIAPLEFGRAAANTQPAPMETQPAPVEAHEMPAAGLRGAIDTQIASFEASAAPLQLTEDVPLLPPSIYGSIDDGMGHETVLVPDAPAANKPGKDQPAIRKKAETGPDFAEFDRTAYETMPSPLEMPKASPSPSIDPHVIDFELFDPATEEEIAPRPLKKN